MAQSHNRAGTNSERQSVGLQGHCDRCAELGHVKAHKNLGCGDVGCNSPHGSDDGVIPARPCGDEVSSLVQAVRDHARTTRKLAKAEAELKAARDTLARVRELHRDMEGWCGWCEVDYPCQHAKMLSDPEGGN